jgi:hypothetical protein
MNINAILSGSLVEAGNIDGKVGPLREAGLAIVATLNDVLGNSRRSAARESGHDLVHE